MNIVHVVAYPEYVDGFGYQENILPVMHKKLGNDVSLITSTEVNRMGIKKTFEVSDYYSKEGIHIYRLANGFKIKKFRNKFPKLKGLYNLLEELKPNFIFIHSACNPTVIDIIKYKKRHRDVQIVADSHTDYINSAKSFISLNIQHKILKKHYIKKVEPFVNMFYGTLPLRCEFLEKVYKLPKTKIDFLPMGFDDSNIDYSNKSFYRDEVRTQFNIDDKDFVVCFGGKIERRKNVIELIKAIKELPTNVKLLIFGTPAEDVKEEFEKEIMSERIVYVGWVKSDEVYKYFFASDIAVFPGTHSVLWEQAISCGLPCIFKKWEGITHVDLGGNCILLDDVSKDILKNNILNLYEDTDLKNRMASIAINEGRKNFSYLEIAKKSLGDLYVND